MTEIAGPWFAVATIVAVVVGPVIAVLITRSIDKRRARKDRQWEIFRNLMQFRRVPLSSDFVGALNLVEVEFAKDAKVISAWKDHLGSFQRSANDALSQEQVGQLRIETQVRLLDAIAKNLGIEVEQLDIYSGGYSPQGWTDAENEQILIRRWLSDIAAGQKAFQVVIHQPHGS